MARIAVSTITGSSLSLYCQDHGSGPRPDGWFANRASELRHQRWSGQCRLSGEQAGRFAIGGVAASCSIIMSSGWPVRTWRALRKGDRRGGCSLCQNHAILDEHACHRWIGPNIAARTLGQRKGELHSNQFRVGLGSAHRHTHPPDRTSCSLRERSAGHRPVRHAAPPGRSKSDSQHGRTRRTR